jgi:YD repeat-containing protein
VYPDIYPTAVTWGANSSTGAGDRYQVTFETSWRGVNQDDADNAHDMTWDYPSNIYGGYRYAPHQTQKLDRIKVWSKQASTWELVRQFDFTYDFRLYSDASTCSVNCSDHSGTYSPDATYRRLTLLSVQRKGKNGTPFPTSANPINTSFTYYDTAADRGTGPRANGGWNRLRTITNGQGGTLTFAYENIAQVYYTCCQGAGYYNSFFNRHRITGKTITDGRGNSHVWNYSYGQAQMNSLGNANGTPSPNTNPNSAALFNWFKNGKPTDTIAVRENTEFRGHDRVTETDPTGAITEHWFIQGLGDSDSDYTNGVGTGCAPVNATDSDACFLTLRDYGFWVGREWKTIWKSAGGGVTLKDALRKFDREFYANTVYEKGGGGTETWPEYPRNGLWRAFAFERQVDERFFEGGSTPKARTTFAEYYPGSGYQAGGQQFGNLTKFAEYGGDGALVRRTKHWYNTRNDESWNWNGNGTNRATYSITYLVDRVAGEGVEDATLAVWQSSNTFYYTDAGTCATSTGPVGTRGLVCRVSRYRNTNAYPYDASDVTYTYDAYGSRATETTYASYGQQTSSGVWTAPGNGSTARTTTYTYDPTFHAFVTRVDYPLNLYEAGSYDYRMGLLTNATDANSVTTTADYDEFGRMITLVKPPDTSSYPTVRFTYVDGVQPVRYQVGLRESTSVLRFIYHFYDGLGREIQTKQWGNVTSDYQTLVADLRYDGRNRVVATSQPHYVNDTNTSYYQYTDPGGGGLYNATTTNYDALDRVTLVQTPDPNVKTTTSYSPGVYGTLVKITDANNHRTEEEQDVLGRRRQVKEYFDGGSGTTSYAYSPLDQLSSVTDAAGNTTTMTYDLLGRKTAISDRDMGSWNYSYDPNGNLTSQRDTRLQWVCFFYDARDRLTGRHDNGSSGTCPANPTTVTYTYDQGAYGKDRRTGMTSPDTSTSWTYDQRGRKTSATHTVAGVTRTFQWAYNSADQVAQLMYPPLSGVTEQVSYTFDKYGRPKSACTNRGGCYLNDGASYDALGQPKQ